MRQTAPAMIEFSLRQMLRLLAGLIGAVLLAGAVAALPAGSGHLALPGFLTLWLHRLGEFGHLRFGLSQVTGAPVATEVLRRLPLTLAIVAPGAGLALLLGIPLGVVLGTFRLGRAAAPLVQIVAAAPVFCASLALLWIAYHGLGWSEVRQAGSILWSQAGGTPLGAAGWIRALGMPALTVGAAGAAAVQLSLRHAAARVGEAPFRRHLRLMGLSALDAELTYLSMPVLAGLCASAGEIVLALFSAAVVAEWVFGLPGDAALFVKSVALDDWQTAAMVLLVFASLKLIADCAGAIAARAIAPGQSLKELTA